MSLPGLASFTEQVGSTFQVLDVSSPLMLKIHRVVEHSKTETNEAFSIFLHGPAEPFMPQGIRKLKHGQFGELDIFLVPVAKTSTGFEYEAAFNYMLST